VVPKATSIKVAETAAKSLLMGFSFVRDKQDSLPVSLAHLGAWLSSSSILPGARRRTITAVTHTFFIPLLLESMAYAA
jgi:hypothetical protein